MGVHYIILDEAYCDSVYNGDKTFEVRYNDRGYQNGDTIRFIPVSKSVEFDHPIKKRVYQITYVHSGLGVEKMFVVLGIKWIDTDR